MKLIEAFISLSHVWLAFIVLILGKIVLLAPLNVRRTPAYHCVPIVEVVVIVPEMTDFVRRFRRFSVNGDLARWVSPKFFRRTSGQGASSDFLYSHVLTGFVAPIVVDLRVECEDLHRIQSTVPASVRPVSSVVPTKTSETTVSVAPSRAKLNCIHHGH